MKFNEVAARITGFSCPIFGISWVAPEHEVTVARRVLTYLEDRRVLYAPEEMELPIRCAQSVQEIRIYLTQELQKRQHTGLLEDSMRAMRTACRNFLSDVQRDPDMLMSAHIHGHFQSWRFFSALGSLRATMGVYCARIAAAYGLDLEDGLARNVPLADTEVR